MAESREQPRAAAGAATGDATHPVAAFAAPGGPAPGEGAAPPETVEPAVDGLPGWGGEGVIPSGDDGARGDAQWPGLAAEAPGPEGLTGDRAWFRPRWEQRLRWQVAAAAALVALVLIARRYPVGPLAGVVSATAWALRTDASPALPWRTVSAWLQRSVTGEFWDALQARGLTGGGPEAAGDGAVGARGAGGAASGTVALPVAGRVLAHGTAGVDLAAAAGAPVRALRTGVVRRVLPDALAGTGVEVEQMGGQVALYRPLTDVRLAPGALVRAGDTLGRLAPPGRLHLELRVSGRAVDPVPYLAAGA